MLLSFFTYLGILGSFLPGKIIPGVTLSDGSRLHYRCNGRPFNHPLCLFQLGFYFYNKFYLICLFVNPDLQFNIISFFFSASALRTVVAPFVDFSTWNWVQDGFSITYCMYPEFLSYHMSTISNLSFN